jgi:tetratricopeptide (TPR) repeat protein
MNDRFPESHLRHEGLAILARILNSLGDFGSVVSLLEGVAPEEVEKEETAVSILLLYSEAHLRRGDPRSAADAAVKMIETFPGNAREKDALYLLAEAYTQLGEHFLAYAQCKVLKERYEETHSDPFLYKTAAQALRELDFRDQALEWLDEGLDRCPAERNATYEMYMLLGDILFEMEMYERAKVVFRKVWGHDALEKDAQVKYVLAQMKQKDYREALRTLRGMEEQAYGDPSHLSEIYKMAGDCFSAIGDMEAAIAAYIGELKDEDAYAREPNIDE